MIKNIKVINANAYNGIVVGFPPVTAFAGMVHALQRKLSCKKQEINFRYFGVFSNKCYIKALKSPHRGNKYVPSFASPIIGTEKEWRTDLAPGFTYQANVDMDVSLLLEIGAEMPLEDVNNFKTNVRNNLMLLRMAGGTILDIGEIEYLVYDSTDLSSDSKLKKSLAGSYALISRVELLDGDEKDKLDIMISALKMTQDAESGKYTRKHEGWIVPIGIGFRAIAPIGRVKNQRDPNIDHRFVEPVYTLGEFKYTANMGNITESLWHYDYDGVLYLCKNEGIL